MLNIQDCYLHPEFDPKKDRETGYRTKSALAIVIKHPADSCRRHKRSQPDHPIGVLQAVNKEGGAVFSAEDEQMLSAVASELAIVTQLHRLSQERKLTEQCTEHIAQAVMHLTTAGHAMPVPELLGSVLETVCRVMSAAHATLYLVKPGVGQSHRTSPWIAIDSLQGPAAPFVVPRELQVLRMAESQLINLFKELSSGRMLNAADNTVLNTNGASKRPAKEQSNQKKHKKEAEEEEENTQDPTDIAWEVVECHGLDTVSVVALPLKNCLGHLVGVLEVRNKINTASVLFNAADEQVAACIGYLCGGALHNSQLQTTRNAKREWAEIYDTLDKNNI